jgi:hypothetical protein
LRDPGILSARSFFAVLGLPFFKDEEVKDGTLHSGLAIGFTLRPYAKSGVARTMPAKWMEEFSYNESRENRSHKARRIFLLTTVTTYEIK